jgi:uncharacterized protein YndB with AHSA1/START domain
MTDRFVYVTYIRTTPDKLWDALLKPEFTRAYWYGLRHDCDWQKGSDWRLTFSDDLVADGEVVEIERPKRLVLKWRHQLMPELHAEGDTRFVIELEQVGEVVKLTITHEVDKPGSKFIQAVSSGFPEILSSLKSLLETGKALPGTDKLPEWLTDETIAKWREPVTGG